MSLDANHMQRIAVGLFADTCGLVHAVRELRADPGAANQLCLLATAARLQAIAPDRHACGSSPLSGIFTQVVEIGRLSDGGALAATYGTLEGVDFNAEWQPQGLLHGLEAALAGGTIALLVKAPSVDHFVAATRTLLRHSPEQVRTREVPKALR